MVFHDSVVQTFVFVRGFRHHQKLNQPNKEDCSIGVTMGRDECQVLSAVDWLASARRQNAAVSFLQATKVFPSVGRTLRRQTEVTQLGFVLGSVFRIMNQGKFNTACVGNTLKGG